MDLTSKKTIKSLCKKYKIWPVKKTSQNFLISKKVINQIIKTARLKKNDIVLEVGPGLGVLTKELAPRVKKVVAIEIDSRFFGIMEELYRFPNLELIRGDVLSLDAREEISKTIGQKPFKVVANLPFTISSRFLRIFLESFQPEAMVLILQKEVAERIVASAGKMSILSFSVQFYSKPRLASVVLRKNFWPTPKVDSALLTVSDIKKNPYQLGEQETKRLFQLVKAGFSSPRKQLKNNLKNVLKISITEIQNILESHGLPPQARAQELSVEDWLSLFKFI